MGLVAVLRGDSWKDAAEAGFALNEAGIEWIEVALTIPGATRAIATLRERGVRHVGAGTVTRAQHVEEVVAAGADFLVSPTGRREIAERAAALNVPSVLGGLTPSEVIDAWEVGAAQVKVFPVGRVGGIHYLDDLAGPFPDVPVMASGGISLEDLPAYRCQRVHSVALGALLADPGEIASHNWDALKARARRVLAVFEGGPNTWRAVPSARTKGGKR
jgi:2-dehydro-3-deoxyphosphogluconate aldolase/(4S)-4-hydroxy-2-oxoglutarate aldolase